MSAERQRSRIVAVFVLVNLIEDLVLFLGSFFQNVAVLAQNLTQSLRFIKFDQARKYRDLTGGDFGAAAGCPGHFTGECAHAQGGDEE